MSDKKKIAVYCSSASELPEDVITTARELGRLIGDLGLTLVYGGVKAGLMHEVAQGAADAGAEIIGVIPDFFIHRADPLCTTLIETPDLNTRKARMIAEADIFVVLPGGLGTIDEWISTSSAMMASRVCDEKRTDLPIIVYNRQGMYDAMVAQFDATNDSIFAHGRFARKGTICPTSEALFEAVAKSVCKN